MAVLGHAQIAGDDAFHRPVLDDQIVRRKARIDFHAQAFRLRPPAICTGWKG